MERFLDITNRLNKMWLLPGMWFIHLEKCDCEQSNPSGPKYGCEACDNLGFVIYHFNSEPNEPNVIGINDRMVND